MGASPPDFNYEAIKIGHGLEEKLNYAKIFLKEYKKESVLFFILFVIFLTLFLDIRPFPFSVQYSTHFMIVLILAYILPFYASFLISRWLSYSKSNYTILRPTKKDKSANKKSILNLQSQAHLIKDFLNKVQQPLFFKCPKCKKSIPSNSNFCEFCGNKM